MSPYRDAAAITAPPVVRLPDGAVRIATLRDPYSWGARYRGLIGVVVMKLGPLYLVKFGETSSALFFPDELRRVKSI